MKRFYDVLYSPVREEYFKEKVEGCVFCNISKTPEDDMKNRVFYRDEFCFGVMNKYPYSPGHFMLIPHSHVNSPSLLDPKTWLHINALSQKAIALLEEYGAGGINLGMNIQKAGGAGIPDHIHMHFVPRYIGDTNFITTIGSARIYGVNQDIIFNEILELAKKHFK
ncbi:HIT domain-containing protein [Helicobacter sp. 11S02629-2]|uniref:HIT family protein n=1 Tax=Helicobacter sp. 11S02629-2 TaxID=1476195 RepID=UPI000BA567C3|nr:HIT domain-containing protein [Helicobacter sp. 11S02629-2]PAF44631.1 HIT family hydrolase [Helicobacter sp. 11S02629-2]